MKKTCGHNCHLLRTGVECSPCKFKTQNDTTMKVIFKRTSEIFSIGEITLLNMVFESKEHFFRYMKDSINYDYVGFYQFDKLVNDVNNEIEVKGLINKICDFHKSKVIVIHIEPSKGKVFGRLGGQIEVKCNAIIQ